MFLYCLLLLSCVSTFVHGDGDRPNILLLLTDDQDVVLGSFDHMPKVHKYLQEQGMTFENAFVHTPICCPSRSSILSGRYIHNGGARNNSFSGNCYGQEWKDHIETKHTYAVHAKNAGYTTAYAGKYLNRYGQCDGKRNEICTDIPPGWDHWLGLVGNSKYYNYSLVEGRMGEPPSVRNYDDIYPEDYLPNVLRNYTLKLLSTMERPWLMAVGWPTPHAPFIPAPWAVNTMNDFHPPITENYNASDFYMRQKHWVIRRLLPMTNKTASRADLVYRRRLEALKSVDRHVGDMIMKLESLGELNRSVILYTSDNGYQFGQHRCGGDKRHLYEHDVRVPFVVRGPNIPANSSSAQLVANIDIAPTILHITEQRKATGHDKMDGRSFWKYIRGYPDPLFTSRRDILISYHGEGKLPCGMVSCPDRHQIDSFNNTYNCVRTLQMGGGENSIYCRFEDDESFVEFYNLTKNPYQLANDYASLTTFQRQRYERRLQELRQCQGSSCQ